MVAIASVDNGNWNDVATWDIRIPLNGDSVTITGGLYVVLNADLAALTLTGLVIDGSLYTGSGADRGIKVNADITGSGYWFIAGGGPGDDWPSDNQMTIDFAGGNNSIVGAGGLILDFRCAEPDNPYVRLSAPEAAGQVELSVDRDVRADLWKVGDTVHIANIAGVRDVEEHTIDAIGVNTITIVGPPGLAANKLEGSYIVLQNRNARIINSTDYAIKNVNGSNIGIEISGCAQGGYISCHNNNIYGTVCGGVNGLRFSDYNIISGALANLTYGLLQSDNGIMSGIIAGAVNGLYTCSGDIVSGIVRGCSYGLTSFSYRNIVTGSIKGCYVGIVEGTAILLGAELENTLSDVAGVRVLECYDTLFDGTIEFSGYTNRAPWMYSFSVNHDQVPGAFKAWTRGGIVTHDTGIKPPGETQSYKHACESATEPVFKQDEVLIQPGDTRTYKVYVRRDAVMGWMPRAQLLLPEEDPLVDAGNTPLDEAVMPAGPVDTWVTMFLTYANTTDYPVKVLVRTLAMSGANNAWFLVKGWGIGGVSRARLVNG